MLVILDEDPRIGVNYGCEDPTTNVEPESQCAANFTVPYWSSGVWSEKCFCDSSYCFDPATDEPYLAMFNDSRGPVYAEVVTEKSVEECVEGGVGGQAGSLPLYLVLLACRFCY